MNPILGRIGRKALALRNRLVKPQPVEISRLLEMLQNAPDDFESAQHWANQVATLLETNLLDRISKNDFSLILAGLVSYRLTGVTPQVSQMALVRAYESSSGLMQEVMHDILFAKSIEIDQCIKSEFFGDVSVSEINPILSELNDQGYATLPWCMDAHWVNALLNEAETFNYNLRDPIRGEAPITNRKINPDHPPQCVAAYAQSSNLAANPLFNKVCNDPLLLHFATRHLDANAQPIDSTLWYSFPSAEPSAEAAQLFHYDLDTLRWLKVFVYLTDVGLENGPHEYVPTSHKPGAKPNQLMNRSYARVTDQEIDEYYPMRRKVICGKKGTVILGDTRCFHRGKAVKADFRLIFSPIYASSKIGYFHGT
jgi:hypothetical protein